MVGQWTDDVELAGVEDAFPRADDVVPDATSAPTPRRHRLWAVAAAVALALVLTGIISDLQVRSDLRQARASLASTRAHLTVVLANLSAVEATLARTSAQRSDLQAALARTSQQLAGAEDSLAGTKQQLSGAQLGLLADGVNTVALNTCLAGVEQALNQVAVGNTSGAAFSISLVASSCQAADGGGAGPGGPVYPYDFPDPDIIRVGNTYYGYATNSAAGNIQMISSTNLTTWNLQGTALPQVPAWARPGYTWAPGVVDLSGRYVLFYSVVDSANALECISEAVAAQPQGPFVDTTTGPLVCQGDLGGSIDPSPFVDPSGRPYLLWKSIGTANQPSTIWTQQLSPDGTGLLGAPTALLGPDQPWEGNVVEGPDMVDVAGTYYLFYSGNNWNSAAYAIGVATCRGSHRPLHEAGRAARAGVAGIDGRPGRAVAVHRRQRQLVDGLPCLERLGRGLSQQPPAVPAASELRRGTDRGAGGPVATGACPALP